MNDYTPKPTEPIMLDGTEAWDTFPLKFADWLMEQYVKGEPVVILYQLPEKWWKKVVRWMMATWIKLKCWLKQEVSE